MKKGLIASVLIFTFTLTGLLEHIVGIDWKVLHAATPSSNTGSLDNLRESSGIMKSFQADLFTGRAQFSVPIFTPPARRSLTPQLGLNYSSSGGNGWLGIGWNLDQGFIERSTKKGFPTYNDSQDTFTLMMQGISSDLVSLGNNEYRAKDESGAFLKLIFQNNIWTVYDKSGTEYQFGASSQSRQTNTLGTFSWRLEKVKDVHGNTITYTYTADSGELYLSTINYNGNETQSFSSTHSVEFILEDRSDITSSYISGAKVEQKKRLKYVYVKVGTSLSRKYVLGYEQSAQVGRTRLVSIQECGTDGTTCLPTQTFTYQNSNVSFASSAVNWPAPIPSGWTSFRTLRARSAEGTYIDIFDINGDGLPDRLYTNPNTEYNEARSSILKL